MKSSNALDYPVWVTVKVVRGFVEDARIFANRPTAQGVQTRWKRACNPDYDEVGMIETRFKVRDRTGIKGRSKKDNRGSR